MSVDLTEEDIIELEKNTTYDVIHIHNNKRKLDGQLKDTTEGQERIVFPPFDLSTKRIGFGNGSNRVTTNAYEIKYHPIHSTLLTYFLIKLSVLDPISPSDTNIHLIPHGSIQSTYAIAVKNQTT